MRKPSRRPAKPCNLIFASINHIASCRSLERLRSISVARSRTSLQSDTLRSRLVHWPASSSSSVRRASRIRSHSGLQRMSAPAGCSGEIGSRRSSMYSFAGDVAVDIFGLAQDVRFQLGNSSLCNVPFCRHVTFGGALFVLLGVGPFDVAITHLN